MLAERFLAADYAPEKVAGEWLVHQWLKKAVLLSFRLNAMKLIDGAPGARFLKVVKEKIESVESLCMI